VSKAGEKEGSAVLHVRSRDGRVVGLAADHVIAATGYRFDLARLPFLGASLKPLLRTEGVWPWLSPHFESSVPGLYFTGIASALRFGPVMRFLVGTAYTAAHVSRHVAVGLGKRTLPDFDIARAMQPGRF
jgi:FAD-dependent urate hydroxylase